MGIVIVLLLLNTCKMNNRLSTQNSTIDSLELSNQKLDSITNKQNETIYTQQVIISDNKEALDKLTDTIFNLKKKDERNTSTIAYYKSVTSTKIRDVKVPYLDSVAMKRFNDSVYQLCSEVIDYIQDSTVKVGTRAEIKTPHFELSQTIQKTHLTIDSFSIEDTLQLRFVERKNGLFKPKTVEVQFFHSNPLVTTTQANSVYYKPKKKSFLTRVVLPVAIGIGAGILISK